MNPSRTDRRDYHHVLQHMTTQHPQRVFPEHIWINWEDYLRTADPFWEANRPATSCMYQGRVNTQGDINITQRMQQWLQELPEPEPQGSLRRLQNNRPRSLSAPTPRPTTCPTPGVANQSPIQGLNHPNPLAQHPVHLEELLPPFKIPQRKSSLQHNLRSSQLSPPRTSPHQQGDLIQGIQHIQLDEPAEFTGTRQLQSSADRNTNTTQLHNNLGMADHWNLMDGLRSASASKRHTVQFGEMMEGLKEHLPVDETKKHGRSDSAAMTDAQPPKKRQKGRLGSVRKRFSIVGTQALDNVQDGRKSSASAMIRELGQASKGFLDKLTHGNSTSLPLANPKRGLASALAPILTYGEENHKIRVAFVGDAYCGKTNLLHRLTTGAFLGQTSTSAPIYSAQMTQPMKVDNYQAILEGWDISAHLSPYQTNPLQLSYFDAIVICFDIKDEANLKSVVDKWQHEANVFAPGIPVILLGLKSDLRRPYPTLKLRFLEEDEPATATIGQGELTAQSIKAAAYFECSARTGEGTADFLESVIRISVNGVKERRKVSKKTRKMSNFFRKK
ncbi:Rho-related GTP-binding protein RhoE [Cytospora mali]|uniref:Rho-related GTP-binding protein RhoE n=1 Tax=Cytospora mali TaxID=578113 RepID=A0A194WBQ7_CYTMA|nr:Rho-related GTP-binding protein RhoE [Valsa mali]